MFIENLNYRWNKKKLKHRAKEKKQPKNLPLDPFHRISVIVLCMYQSHAAYNGKDAV